MSTAKLQKEFINITPRASRLKDVLVHQLNHLFDKNSVSLGVPIESRVKEWSSIEEKIERKTKILKNISDLEDLIGIRIIVLFRKDQNLVDGLIREHLTVVSSEDTGSRLADSQFGYQSLHYVIQLPKEWLKIPSNTDFGDLKVEVQVRTLAQHIWAAASHKLQYKNEDSVPYQLRRSINRVSAILETADIEFDRFLIERQQYVDQDMNVLAIGEPLNVDNVEAVLTELLPPQNKKPNEPYADLVSDLNNNGISTISQLRELLTNNMKEIENIEADAANRYNRPSYFRHVGLTRVLLKKI